MEKFKCHFSRRRSILGEVKLSLFVAGTVRGEIWKDRRSATCCVFSAASVKSNLSCAAGCRTGWRVTLVALRIVNDVSYVTRIKHASHFAWQA